MNLRDAGFAWMELLFNSRARQAVYGLSLLRRTYGHILVMAALEGSRDVPRPYYQDYVDALEIISGRAEWIAKAL
jgi:hypothetical protein